MGVLAAWRSWHRRQQLVHQLAAARRAGQGLHREAWYIEPAADQDQQTATQQLLEAVVAWCRDVLAQGRRPWGIDHFDLTLAWTTDLGEPARRVGFHRLRPADLYGAAPLTEQLRTVLRLQDGDSVYVSAALFSWGDAAHAALDYSGH